MMSTMEHDSVEVYEDELHRAYLRAKNIIEQREWKPAKSSAKKELSAR
jgi:hypothetical protein